MSETVYIEGYVKTNTVGSNAKFDMEVDMDEWEEMTDEEKDRLVFDRACEFIDFNYTVDGE